MLNVILYALCAFAGWLIACYAARRANGDPGAAVMTVLSMFGAAILAVIIFAILFDSAGDRVTGIRVGIFLISYAASLFFGERLRLFR